VRFIKADAAPSVKLDPPTQLGGGSKAGSGAPSAEPPTAVDVSAAAEAPTAWGASDGPAEQAASEGGPPPPSANWDPATIGMVDLRSSAIAGDAAALLRAGMSQKAQQDLVFDRQHSSDA
jgi:hypothetical protein